MVIKLLLLLTYTSLAVSNLISYLWNITFPPLSTSFPWLKIIWRIQTAAHSLFLPLSLPSVSFQFWLLAWWLQWYHFLLYPQNLKFLPSDLRLDCLCCMSLSWFCWWYKILWLFNFQIGAHLDLFFPCRICHLWRFQCLPPALLVFVSWLTWWTSHHVFRSFHPLLILTHALASI